MKNCTICSHDFKAISPLMTCCSKSCIRASYEKKMIEEEQVKKAKQKAKQKCKTPWKQFYIYEEKEALTDPRNNLRDYLCGCGFYHFATIKK